MNAVLRRFLWVLALLAGMSQSFAAGLTLGIKPAGRNIVLSWPVTPTNYVLQSTPTLAAASWSSVPNLVTVTANTNYVTYTNNSVTRFFRLFLDTSTGFRLSIARSNNLFIVFWPAAASNYVLQSTFALSPASWVTVTNPPPVTVNNTNFVTFTNTSSSRFFRLYGNTNTPSPFAGMVQIPAGPFTLGDVNDGNADGDAAPVSVTVSAFYMDTNLVTLAQWQSIYNWATSVGYDFLNSGLGKGPDHPVQTVNWYDTVKWCNARSQLAGLTPVYYTDPGLTLAFTNGQTDAVYANWAATGFRLPTEAEWEKAARGGLSGMRFPWGNTIRETQANYYGDTNTYSYDLGPNRNNPAFGYGGQPFTSPAGYFAPNGYGLCDMAGNVMEWCWDWYGTPYLSGTDPHGPATGSNRVLRGGDWSDDAGMARCSERSLYSRTVGFTPGTAYGGVFGFRCVRGH